jgi:gamma-glutamylputrescine oxidase
MLKTWSYWEKSFWKKPQDLIVVGAGITGLSAAIHAKLEHPTWQISILERDIVAEGASTKNAGFACYGTIGEINSDVKVMGHSASLALVEQRIRGLEFLQNFISPTSLNFKRTGGTEIYLKGQEKDWEEARAAIENYNTYFHASLGFDLFVANNHYQNFPNGIASIFSPLEAQLNPVLLVSELRQKAQGLGIQIINGVLVQQRIKQDGLWVIESSQGKWQSVRLLYCTNAFSADDLSLDIQPSRNQVLVTSPFQHGLKEGNYHVDEGYIYFRTIGDRLLIGGARNRDAVMENTAELGLNEYLQEYLLHYLKEKLGFNQSFTVDQAWSGIIATGNSKQPICEQMEENLWFCGRFGGMGVALSAISGKKVAQKL